MVLDETIEILKTPVRIGEPSVRKKLFKRIRDKFKKTKQDTMEMRPLLLDDEDKEIFENEVSD